MGLKSAVDHSIDRGMMWASKKAGDAVDLLPNTNAELSKSAAGKTLGELSAYRQQEERRTKGERIDPEKELPEAKPYSYALEHPYMFTPEQASAVRKAQEEGKTTEDGAS